MLFIRSAGEDTLVLEGELDMATVDSLVEAVTGRTERPELRLEMSNVTFVDSTGIRGLARISTMLAPGQLILVAPHARVRRVLDLIGLQEIGVFSIDDSIGEREDIGS